MIPSGSQAISIEGLYTRMFIHTSPLFRTNCVVYFIKETVKKFFFSDSQDQQDKDED
jgi:hypothetical protein